MFRQFVQALLQLGLGSRLETNRFKIGPVTWLKGMISRASQNVLAQKVDKST
jgi:hypothetical protein